MNDDYEIRIISYDMIKFLNDYINKYGECSDYEANFRKISAPNLIENIHERKTRYPKIEIKKDICFYS